MDAMCSKPSLAPSSRTIQNDISVSVIGQDNYLKGITWTNGNPDNGCNVGVWECISQFILHFVMDVIIYPRWDLS